MEYPEKFKAKMVQKLTAPGAAAAAALSEEIGVPQPTLSRWVRGRRVELAQSNRAEVAHFSQAARVRMEIIA